MTFSSLNSAAILLFSMFSASTVSRISQSWQVVELFYQHYFGDFEALKKKGQFKLLKPDSIKQLWGFTTKISSKIFEQV